MTTRYNRIPRNVRAYNQRPAQEKIMTTRQTSFQLDADTEALIAFLKDRGYGTTTNILRTAVKRMAEEEGRTMDTQKIDKFGRIAQGTYVTMRDGSTGQVVNSNTSRVLVQYPSRGGGTDSNWFENEEVIVK